MTMQAFKIRVVAAGVWSLMYGAAWAAPLPLAQVPQSTAVMEPAPNVIVSIDNSGSMAFSSDASEGDVASTNGSPSRIEALQDALHANFSASKIPDGRIRLAWQSMNEVANNANTCKGFMGEMGAGGCVYGGVNNANLIRSLEGAHRDNFFAWIDGLQIRGGTPSHAMMARAGEYMKTTGSFNPYNNTPGSPVDGAFSCRKTYHLFMTDGDYNFFGFDEHPNLGMPTIGNADGTSSTLPDGKLYTPMPPYKDTAGALPTQGNWQINVDGVLRPTKEFRPTLADMAFHYWKTDLQPGIANNVPTIKRVSVNETHGSKTFTPYWNPKNDPATWQHMNTSFIGFGAAYAWQGKPLIDVNAAQPTYSGDYSKLAAGSRKWVNPLRKTLKRNHAYDPYIRGWRGWYAGIGDDQTDKGYWAESDSSDEAQKAAVRADLWHAALNARGTFTPASNAAALGNAFDAILSDILNNSETSLGSMSASSTVYKVGSSIFHTGYETERWSGILESYKVNTNGSDTLQWSAATVLDNQVNVSNPMAARTILTTLSSGQGGSHSGPFQWLSISQDQKNALKGTYSTAPADEAAGQNVLNYLRGDRSLEEPAGNMRERESVLGDIVNSQAWHVGQPRDGFLRYSYPEFVVNKASRTPHLYVGANDGMLHAFRASDGHESFAYVPAGVFGTAADPKLQKLSGPNYTHRYYVDGSPVVGDVFMGDTGSTNAGLNVGNWKSLLFGTLGAGGKGYFLLDVTNPAGVAENSNILLTDTTDTNDPDIGYMVQDPLIDSGSGRAKQFARVRDAGSNGSRPALIMGNGVNSTDEKAALIIQYLDGSREIKKIYATTTAGAGNGLFTPDLVNPRANGITDYAYAGDMHGNLWKFDLSSDNPSGWKVSSGTTIAADGAPLFTDPDGKPITAAPRAFLHPMGGYVVVFGTGRAMTEADTYTNQTQMLYGVWDQSTGTVNRADLVTQEFVSPQPPSGYRKLKPGGVEYSIDIGVTSQKGWALELPASRERMVANVEALSNSVSLIRSLIPATPSTDDACTAGTPNQGWVMALDAFSGNTPSVDVFGSGDVMDVGYFNTGSDAMLAFQTADYGQFLIRDAAGNAISGNVKRPGEDFGWRSRVPMAE